MRKVNMMSDNLSHDVDVTDPGDTWDKDKKQSEVAGKIVAGTLEWDIDNIFIAFMSALTDANGHRLVKNLEHTKSKYDNFMQDFEDTMSEVVDEKF